MNRPGEAFDLPLTNSHQSPPRVGVAGFAAAEVEVRAVKPKSRFAGQITGCWTEATILSKLILIITALPLYQQFPDIPGWIIASVITEDHRSSLSTHGAALCTMKGSRKK